MAAKQVPGPSRTTEENATMHLWKKEALKSMREELGRVPMDVVMIKKLEKADIPSPDNKGFLSHEQLHVVESKTTRAEQMNMVIDYLLEMEDKYFEDFCTILKQCNFEGKAYMLRGKAEEFKRYFDAQEAASIAAMPPPPPGGDSNADEAALKRLCWIPFGIKTVSIEAKGGILCLEPTSDDLQEMKEDTIFVEVPPDAVSTSADVKMHYAIIPSGSFTLPEGYRFGSPVVYIYYDSQRVTKPLTLHLPHCYGGEDHARDGLSFAVAPHSLKGGMTAYQFQLIGGGTFYKYQQNGIFLIDGHSTLFADVFKEKATSVYLATQWEQRLANKTHTKIVITYFSKVWPKIVAKYWKRWKQNKHTSPTPFQFAGSWLSWLPGSTKSRVCGQLSCRHGQGWTATLVGANTFNQEDVAFRNKYNEQELEDLVAEGLYPPAIHCAVTYSRPPDFEHVSLETLEVGMTGTDKQQVTFPVEVYQANATPPTHPEGVEQTETNPAAGGSCLTKRSPELQDQPPAKREDSFSLTGSEGRVEAVGFSSSTPPTHPEGVAQTETNPVAATFAQVIQDHTEEFLQEMNAKEIAPKLKECELIPDSVEFDILHSKTKELANICLLRHLKVDADEEAATKVFGIASEMTSYGKMNTFAAGVLRKLQRDTPPTHPEGVEETENILAADFKKTLEAALAEGSVEVEMVKCVTLGPSEAGKTQLKSALIGKFDHSSESTPMSTGAEVVVQRYVHGKSTWQPLTRERLLKSLNTTLKKMRFTESASPSPTEPMQKNEAQAVGVDPLKTGMHKSTGVISASVEEEAQAVGVEPLKTGMHKSTGVHEDATGALAQRADRKKALRSQFAAIRASVEEELMEAGTAEVKGLDKVRVIHMIDSGGQPAFFDIHPVIATSRAVYLLVYNMKEGLDHKPAITYRRKAFPTKQLLNTKLSNLDMIKDSLLTLHDCKQKFNALESELHHWFGASISKSADGLPVLVVGTRKMKESIAHEYEKLEKECSYLPLWNKVLSNTDTGFKLFAVESTDPDCEGVQSVRQEVDRAGCIFKLPLPISWFLCQLIFLSVDENLHVLSFSNLQDLCLQEGLISNPDDFLAMIRTFHLLGIFSFPYLDQELTLHDHWRPDDKPVFTNPDVLYQEVTKILEMAYRDLAKTPMEPKAKESLTTLQSSGRLDSDTLGYLGIPDDLGFYSGFHAYLLERLVHWGLAAKPTTEISEGAAVAERAAFFIPSVLPACDKKPVIRSESLLSFTFCLPLADGNKVHYVPHGIFPHLVVHIEGRGYVIQKNLERTNYLFRDVALFSIKRSNKMQYAYNVMVVDKMNHITISIDPAHESKDKSSPADCRQIVSDFKHAMEATYTRIYHTSLEVTLASECRCNRPGTPASHLAMIHCQGGHYEMQCLLPLLPLWYDCPPKLAALLCDQASSFSASTFLKAYEDEFAEVVHAKQSLLKLKYKGVISADVKTSIESANEEDAKYLLLEHLEKNATVGTLREYSKVAIAADDYPRMQELGRKMINTLPPEEVTPPIHPEGVEQTDTNPATGESSLRKRSPESALPPAKRVDRCALTGSEGSVEAVDVSSSARVVSRGADAAESSPICEATMCLWKKEALKSMRQELGRVKMDVGMIKKLEKADIPSPDNKGFLSHEQLQVVESKTTPAEQMNMIIDYLLEIEDIYFEYFCQILEQGAFKAKAKMLRDKAKECKEYYATPPTHPEGAAQTGTDRAAGSSTVFAIITANPTEENAVRHFLQLGENRGEVWEGAHDCIWEKDPYLKSNKVTVTDTAADKNCGYELFTLAREGRSKKVVGVHIKCLQQAAFTEDGAQDTATTLLQHASRWKSQLTDIFSVGYCSCADDGQSKENLTGYVLLANQFEAYLNRGKMAEGTMQHHPEVYRANRKWISDLQDLRITKPARQSGTDGQALVKFKDIPVKEVPRIESGPLVVKSDEYSQELRGLSYRSGIEMEAIGFIKALNSYERQGNQNIPKFASVKGVSDFGSGKHRKKATTFFGQKTPALSDDERQQVATLHSIALVIRGVVERYLVPRKVANFEQLL